MTGVRASLGALSADQRELLRTKVVQGERSADEWHALLAPLQVLDGQADAARSRAGKALLWLYLGGGLLVFVLLFLAPLVALALLVLVTVPIVVLHLRRGRLKRLDLGDAALGLALPLLPLLAEDAADDAPLTLGLDLRGPTADEKQTGSSDPYARGAYHRIVDFFYADPFLHARVRFADGADVRLEAVEHVRRSRRTKRNPRGKIKTKVKDKRRVQLDVAVAFPAKNYAAAGPGGGALPPTDRERIAARDGRTVVRERRVVKASGAGGPIDPAHVVDLLARAYGRVEPARRKKL
ncbi:hypothetical protein [Patulibacter defluvii]|uniref:hypothetical protein n=1 Tax=Patulibacter defluvii TaxID=3095358 RepID=UPI002A74E080|nr:hypothetical protein [Patulibacter sp. DM4]